MKKNKTNDNKHEETAVSDNKWSTSDVSIKEWIAKHPVYTIPACGIYAYVVCAIYLDGLLSIYSVKAFMFDPSIFRLVAFAWKPLIASAFIIILLMLLTNYTEVKLWKWISAYVVWLIILIVAYGFRFAIYVNADIPMAWIVSLAVVLLWAIIPLLCQYVTRRSQRVVDQAMDKIDRLKVFDTALEEGRLDDSKLVEVRILANEVEELYIHCKEQHRKLTTPYSNLIILIGIAACYLQIVNWVGESVAYYSYLRTELMSNQNDLVEDIVLFTDGEAVLLRHIEKGLTTTIFKIENAGIKMENMKLGGKFGSKYTDTPTT